MAGDRPDRSACGKPLQPAAVRLSGQPQTETGSGQKISSLRCVTDPHGLASDNPEQLVMVWLYARGHHADLLRQRRRPHALRCRWDPRRTDEQRNAAVELVQAFLLPHVAPAETRAVVTVGGSAEKVS